MSFYCINPLCEQRKNPDNTETCLSCGSPLLINNRIRLLKPLRELTYDPRSYFEVFEVDDAGTKWHPVRKRRVMKVLKWNSTRLRELIKREFGALRLIQHPNIPQCDVEDFFSFVPNNSPLELRCLVMDKIEGQNLEEWIKENEPISQAQALEWLRQLVEILDVVHHTEFFHRDIKPANIILQPKGELALIDFGTARRITDTYLAKVSASGGTDTRVGNYEITTVVSHYYTPLEQIYGKAVPQSDFYALGRTFVRLVTGIPLMQLPTDKKTERLIWRDKARQIDKPFADLLDDLMSLSPGRRPQTTEVILQRLERLPFKLNINRIVKSKLFGFGLSSLLLLGIYGTYKGYNLLLFNYYFNEASRNLDDLKVAKKYYESAIKYNQKDVAAFSNLALACQQLGDIKCVTENYDKAFKLKPDTWEARYGLGNFYEEQGRYDLAEQQYRLAIKYSNNQAMNAVSNLARLKNLQEKYSEAAALALQGLNRTQNREWQAGLYKNLGWARFKQQRYVEAEDYLQKSVKLDSERVDAYCLLAQTYEALGNLSKAKIYWEVCLLATSSLPEVQEWRQQVLRRLLQKN
ncbi:tetratricopeptide repeat protein [Nostoc linckia FACHB-391]|uniref:non-specific serine/threonine protein kinase n=2 Tax=Nostoc TaxID=1177 RepID=A0ABR8IH58_9NOSO|nr:serine/threonine-protein kinase [Nostoc linckia]MBD2564093.1 tetratricopeptide repeat protein [Nostoc linckia FACHB-391]MBD2649830.1 tetratricopeptide repeat protein [Nostoc foliaceum FACHB-393]